MNVVDERHWNQLAVVYTRNGEVNYVSHTIPVPTGHGRSGHNSLLQSVANVLCWGSSEVVLRVIPWRFDCQSPFCICSISFRVIRQCFDVTTLLQHIMVIWFSFNPAFKSARPPSRSPVLRFKTLLWSQVEVEGTLGSQSVTLIYSSWFDSL